MLLCLPTELIVEIFDKADSFTTAFALSHTCHRLRTIWKANANAILPSVVECFPQALDLAQTQDMFRHDKYGRIQEITHSRQKDRVLHPERIERNATLVSHILPYYEHNIVNAFALRGIKRDALRTDERTDILRAIYRAMTLTAAHKERGASQCFLAPLDIRDYKQMREAMYFLKSWFASDERESLNIYDPNYMKDWRLDRGNAFRRRASYYLMASCRLTLLEADLMFSTVDDAYYKNWGSVPWGNRTIVDGDAKDAGSGRGIFMGEILPVLEQRRISRGDRALW